MEIVCPACKKSNQTGTSCARCGCELEMLYRVLAGAAAAFEAARNCLQASDWAGALSHAERSWDLCHSVESAHLAFLAAGALGETPAALAWRARGTPAFPESVS